MKVLIFDLDDTLYEEYSFVKNGFKAVSLYFKKKYNLNSDTVYKQLIHYEKTKGRGKIFNDILNFYKLKNIHLSELIKIYRNNNYKLKLYPDAQKILKKFKKKAYLVTDGNSRVQRNKIKLLKIEKYFKKIFCTRQYGLDKEKPSLYVFKKIARIEKKSLKNLVYIGDNPNKDFVNLNKSSSTTIRLFRGQYKYTKVKNGFNAKYKIKNLNQILKYV